MPTYSYECLKCGFIIDRFLPVSQFQNEMVGDCECGDTEEIVNWKIVVLSPTEFRLKGKGWYETDSKNSAFDNIRRVSE